MHPLYRISSPSTGWMNRLINEILVSKPKLTTILPLSIYHINSISILSRLWSAVCTGEELSEDELNQIIMVQYPEEDLPDGVMARSPPPSTPVTFSLGAPSSEDLTQTTNRRVRFKSKIRWTITVGNYICVCMIKTWPLLVYIYLRSQAITL